MKQVVALSLSIASLATLWAFLALGPLSGFVIIWAGFIAWACFFHSGANCEALVKTVLGNAYGVLIAWIALLTIVYVPLSNFGAIWQAIVVGITVFFLIIVGTIHPLSAVPANISGYAAVIAYSLRPPFAGPLHNLLSPSFANPLPLLFVSMVTGALFGYISNQLASKMTKGTRRAAKMST
jgi:Protein of unknown function (DUF1097)